MISPEIAFMFRFSTFPSPLSVFNKSFAHESLGHRNPNRPSSFIYSALDTFKPFSFLNLPTYLKVRDMKVLFFLPGMLFSHMST